jgi:nucleoside-diphosphate-sugar epimerase
VSAGHDVVATFQGQLNDYTEIREKRVRALAKLCRPEFITSFGDDRFLKLIKEGSWDLLCHHAADVTNYKSQDFDVAAALANNTRQLPTALDSLMDVGCNGVIVTGSVFENDEGVGSDDLRAFSPYGLAKAFTWQVFRYHAQIRRLKLGKFVIPNPFGPFEESRFTSYLIQSWLSEKIPVVRTPDYVRDNIHVSLLARAYADFAARLVDGVSRYRPSGYVESQGAFAKRVANEMQLRLGLRCELELKSQTECLEPRVRINTDWLDAKMLKWNEASAWDEIAEYYKGNP